MRVTDGTFTIKWQYRAFVMAQKQFDYFEVISTKYTSVRHIMPYFAQWHAKMLITWHSHIKSYQSQFNKALNILY